MKLFIGIVIGLLGAIGWHYARCLLDQRDTITQVRDQWSSLRTSTQQYFDSQDAFHDRISMFLDKVHSSKPSAEAIETDKQQLITSIETLDQECNRLRATRYKFAMTWNHMESVFRIPESVWPDISGQCTHWPRFAEELRSTDSMKLITDPVYKAHFYSNKEQLEPARRVLERERESEHKQAEETNKILASIDGRSVAGNCWTCTRSILR